MWGTDHEGERERGSEGGLDCVGVCCANWCAVSVAWELLEPSDEANLLLLYECS